MKVRLAGIRPVTKIRGRQRQEAGTQRRKEIVSAAVVLVDACSSQLQQVALGAVTCSGVVVDLQQAWRAPPRLGKVLNEIVTIMLFLFSF